MYWGPRYILYCFDLFFHKGGWAICLSKDHQYSRYSLPFFFFVLIKSSLITVFKGNVFFYGHMMPFNTPDAFAFTGPFLHTQTHTYLHTHINLCKTIFCDWYKDEYNLKWIIFLYSPNFKRNETFWGVSKVSWTLGEGPFMLNWLLNSPLC